MFKKYVIVFVVGVVLGAAGLLALTRIGTGGSETVKVTQIFGEKISHSDFKTSGSAVEFTTTAEGDGVIKTEIPKMMIPEALAWLTYNHGVSIGVMYQYDFLVHQFRPTYMLGYSYRFSRVSVGLGVCGSQNSAGVCGSGSYWF